MLKQSLLLGSMAAVLFGVVANAQQAPLQPSPVKRTPLGKVEVPGSNYEVIFGITELAPGFKSGRHSHPGLVMAYVAEGSSTARRSAFTRSARRFNCPTARSTTKAPLAASPSR